MTGYRFTAHLEDDHAVVAAADTDTALLLLLALHAEALHPHHHLIHIEAATGRTEFEFVSDRGDDVETVVYLVDENADWPVVQ